MKEPKDLLFPKGFSEVDDLKKKEMQRPKLKKEKELTPIESFNNKLGELFKINTGVSEEKKKKIGIIITTLIILTIVISAYYFLIFEPTQQALNEAKTSKLNELHTYYKGPLASAGSVFKIEDEINSARSVGEVESITIIPQATKDWKNHHLKSIKMNTDKFNRTMAVYENNGKNVIMPVDDAISIVNDNDARKLCEISFKKPNTVSVPILVSRLQAGAGLISVGSIVDIYKNNNDTLNQTNLNKTEADVSGCTVLSIMRYEENGEIESQYTKGHTIVQGENTNPNEDSQTFTSNVLELLKGSIIRGYDEKTTMDMLRNYGIKLSNYEREINLGDLDAEYMILIEVPQEKVNFVIDNMDEIVLTIPTANAPSWMAGQLNSTYTIG